MAATPRILGSAAAGIAALLLFAAGGVSAAAPKVIGIAAAIVNDVRIKGAAADQFARAALRQRVALADQVQTGGGSRLQLLLLDKSKFTVGANARLTIDRFVYDPDGSSLSASVAKGAFRFMSGRSGGSGSRSIDTPAATIGIRGTLLDGVVGAEAAAIARGERDVGGDIRHDPATATLVVLRGPGPGRQGNDRPGVVEVTAGGQTVALDRPLAAAYVPHAGAAPIVFTISSPGIARLNDLLLEPREILTDPGAPGQPYAEPRQDEQPDRYGRYGPGYDRRGPGGFDDGRDFGPRGGDGYGPRDIPGSGGFPNGQGVPRGGPNGAVDQNAPRPGAVRGQAPNNQQADPVPAPNLQPNGQVNGQAANSPDRSAAGVP